MGGTAVRAVALCNTSLIERINESFIPVFADEFEKNNGAWTRLLGPDLPADAPARRLLNEIHSRYQQQDGRLIKLYVVTLDGRIHEGRRNLMDDDPLLAVRSELAPFVESAYGQPPPPVAAYRSGPARTSVADAESLRVVVRYALPPTQEALELHNRQQVDVLASFVYMPAFGAPLRDWITLKRDEVEKLLPPAPAIAGQKYSVTPVLAADIMRHFCPESGPVYVTENKPQTVEMNCTVSSVSPTSVRVMIRARSQIANRGLTGLVDPRVPLSRLDVAMVGFIDFDPVSRHLQDMQLASDGAFDVGPGGALEFRATAFRVPPETATTSTCEADPRP